MARSIWKGFFLDSFFFTRAKTKKNLYIWSRASTIPQSLIGFTVFLYTTEKFFKKLKITRDKVGFKFGFFITTRVRPLSKKPKKNKFNYL